MKVVGTPPKAELREEDFLPVPFRRISLRRVSWRQYVSSDEESEPEDPMDLYDSDGEPYPVYDPWKEASMEDSDHTKKLACVTMLKSVPELSSVYRTARRYDRWLLVNYDWEPPDGVFEQWKINTTEKLLMFRDGVGRAAPAEVQGRSRRRGRGAMEYASMVWKGRTVDFSTPPKWFGTKFRASHWMFRSKVGYLGAFRKALTLLVRLNWAIYQTQSWTESIFSQYSYGYSRNSIAKSLRSAAKNFRRAYAC